MKENKEKYTNSQESSTASESYNNIEELKLSIEKEKDIVIGLKRRIEALVSNLDFESNGGRIFYAVDFCEIYSYLRQDKIDRDIIGLGLKNKEKAFNYHRIGLSYLFKNLRKNLYVLPPHVDEMWYFVKKLQGMDQEYHNIQKKINKLDSTEKRILDLLQSAKNKGLSNSDIVDIIHSVKGNFERLCLRVSDFIDKCDKKSTLTNLNDLIREKFIVDTNDIFKEIGQNNIMFEIPSTNEEEMIFNHFYKSDEKEKMWIAYMNDASSILILRNVNKQLKKFNAKLLLVTRDKKIRRALDNVIENEPSFDWENPRSYLRHPDTIFLDIVMQGFSPLSQNRREKLMNIITMLSFLERSFSKILQNKKQISYNDIEFLRRGEILLGVIYKMWDAELNICLSLSQDKLKWIDPVNNDNKNESNLDNIKNKVLNSDTYKDLDEKEKCDFKENFELLSHLCDFVDNNAHYRTIALGDMKIVTNGMQLLSLKSIFSLFLGNTPHHSFNSIIGQKLENDNRSDDQYITILRSTKWNTVYSLNFFSKKYQNYFSKLRCADEKIRFETIRNYFLCHLETNNLPHHPEDFLFMAFALSLLNYWSVAYRTTEYALQIYNSNEEFYKKDSNLYEMCYFLSMCKRKSIFENYDDKVNNKREYLNIMYKLENSFKRILVSYNANQKDARFLKEMGILILMYYYYVRKQKLKKEQIDNIFNKYSEEFAFNLLTEALHLSKNNIKLKILILNNLAYFYAKLEKPDFKKSKQYIEQIDEEFEKISDSPELYDPKEPWTYLLDTKFYIRGLMAIKQNNIGLLEESINDLELLLCDTADVDISTKKYIQNHISELSELSCTLRIKNKKSAGLIFPSFTDEKSFGK